MKTEHTSGVGPLIDAAFTRSQTNDPLAAPVQVKKDDEGFPAVVLSMTEGKVTRENLAYDLQRVGNVTLDIAKMQVQAVIARIADAMLNGHDVEIRGLGSFKLKESLPKKRLDPRTKAVLGTWPHRAVRFKVSGVLDERINKRMRDPAPPPCPYPQAVLK